MSGISATQVVQLVAQKLTRVTLPRSCAVVWLEPSSSTKVDSGAADWPLPSSAQVPTEAATASAAAINACLNRIQLPKKMAAIVRQAGPYSVSDTPARQRFTPSGRHSHICR